MGHADSSNVLSDSAFVKTVVATGSGAPFLYASRTFGRPGWTVDDG